MWVAGCGAGRYLLVAQLAGEALGPVPHRCAGGAGCLHPGLDLRRQLQSGPGSDTLPGRYCPVAALTLPGVLLAALQAHCLAGVDQEAPVGRQSEPGVLASEFLEPRFHSAVRHHQSQAARGEHLANLERNAPSCRRHRIAVSQSRPALAARIVSLQAHSHLRRKSPPTQPVLMLDRLLRTRYGRAHDDCYDLR